MDTDTPPPHWLPDWKDPTAYQKIIPFWVESKEMHRFYAWQFLRRNTQYQNTYATIFEQAEQVDELLENTPGRGYARCSGISAFTEENSQVSNGQVACNSLTLL
jgi:hypothetical protein